MTTSRRALLQVSVAAVATAAAPVTVAATVPAQAVTPAFATLGRTYWQAHTLYRAMLEDIDCPEDTSDDALDDVTDAYFDLVKTPAATLADLAEKARVIYRETACERDSTLGEWILLMLVRDIARLGNVELDDRKAGRDVKAPCRRFGVRHKQFGRIGERLGMEASS